LSKTLEKWPENFPELTEKFPDIVPYSWEIPTEFP